MAKLLQGAFCVLLFILGLISSAHAALIGRLPATPGGTDYQADASLRWLDD
jgi:hypothetical protein